MLGKTVTNSLSQRISLNRLLQELLPTGKLSQSCYKGTTHRTVSEIRQKMFTIFKLKSHL